MNLTAIGEHVIVELNPREAESVGGIYIPELAREKPQEGKVISIGKAVDIPIEIGSEVGCSKIAGTVAVMGGREVLFIHQDKLLYVRL